MTFTVTYRGANGAPVTETVEAASRAECLAQLKARGIAATGVMEGARSGRSAVSPKGEPKSCVRSGKDACSPGRRNVALAICVACVLLAVIGGGAWWWFGRGIEAAPQDDGPMRPRGLVREVTPAAAPKPIPARDVAKVKAEAKANASGHQEERPRRIGEFRDGYVLLPSGELRKAAGIVTSVVVSTSIADTTFKHDAERSIAHLLLVEPGEGMLGDGESLYANFNEEFRESLKDEIVFTDEDTPSQRELKAAMIDIRQELIERMNRGEDLAKVMAETRKQLQELSLYKDELAAQVERLKEDGTLTKQDRLDLLEAANQMLEERGIKPFLVPSSLQHLIDIREAQKMESASQKGNPQ